MIPTASGGTSSVALRTARSIAAGSTITLSPQNYEIPTGSSNVLTRQGYGAVSKSVGFSATSWPCHRACWLTWESVILIR